MSRSASLHLQSLTRVRYISGQLLSADDLDTEQQYHRDRARLHHRLLHGTGVVAGLVVRTSGGQIVVAPGLALDPSGDEIVIAAEHVIALPAKSDGLKAQHVVARYAETLAVPAPPTGTNDDEPRFTRVVEGFAITLEAAAPPRGNISVTLARLTWRSGKWRVDSRFKVKKVRR